MDTTNNSGVQDSLLQAPQAMADEDYPCKNQHGGLTDGQSNRKPFSKRSSEGCVTTGRPLHINPASSRKRVSTSYQSSCSESLPRQGSLQNGRSASCEIPITERGLYDETGLEGCLLCNPHSPIPQEVPEVCVSEQSLRVSVPSIWSVIGSSSLYENSKTSVSSAAFSRNLDCYLHRGHAATSSTEQGTAKDAQVVAFLEKLGFLVKIENCSVAPSQCIVFLGAKLDSTTMTISLP